MQPTKQASTKNVSYIVITVPNTIEIIEPVVEAVSEEETQCLEEEYLRIEEKIQYYHMAHSQY